MCPPASIRHPLLALAVENPVDGGAIAGFLKTREEFKIAVEARSLPELAASLRTCPCHLLLLHQDLPGTVDPWEAIQEIRREFKDLKIIYIAPKGGSRGSSGRPPADLGITSMLYAPFSAAELLSVIGWVASAARTRTGDPGYPDKGTDGVTGVLDEGTGGSQESAALLTGSGIFPGGNVVALYSPTGGVGTTTLVANLATTLATGTDLRIALVDFNLDQPDLSLYLDLLPTGAGEKLPCLSQLLPLLEGGRIDSEILEGYLVAARFAPGLRVLPGLLDLRQAAYVSDSHLKTLLRLLTESHHLVLVDTGCSVRDVGTYSALRVARQIILVGSRSSGSRFHLRRFLSLWDQLKMPHGNIRLVLSQWPAGVPPGDTERDLGLEAVAIIPQIAERLDRAIDDGVPLVKSKGADLAEFRSAIAAVAEVLYPGQGPKPEKQSGFLAGLRRRKGGKLS